MKINDIIKRDVVSITASASIGQATELFISRHIGTLPVVDQSHAMVGAVSLSDVLCLVMPDFVHLIEDFEFVHDFGAAESRKPFLRYLARPVTQVMQELIFVEDESAGNCRQRCRLCRIFLRAQRPLAHAIGVSNRRIVGSVKGMTSLQFL